MWRKTLSSLFRELRNVVFERDAVKLSFTQAIVIQYVTSRRLLVTTFVR